MNKFSNGIPSRTAIDRKHAMRGTQRHGLVQTLIGLVLFSVMSVALAQSQFEDDYDDENKPWEEIVVQLPPAPQADDLIPFYVGPTATQSFSIDTNSITVGTDGVVRYTLVAVSREGARNISYEGIRCASFEHKIYALGHANGTWSRSRRNQWSGIVRGAANRQHAALALDYFCSNLTVAGNAQQIVQRIKTKKSLTEDLTR
jgi:hypothetical protein